MFDLRIAAFTTITLVVALGTAYSIAYGTYLDTSDPLIAHLAHPLGGTHYWARKSNFINVYFIKKAWGWTSAAFLISWGTSQPSLRSAARLSQWLVGTVCWLSFTTWCFGPAIVDRVIVASGGECFVSLPSGNPIIVPTEYCFTKSTVNPTTHPDIFTSSLVLPTEWTGVPRLRRGHDVSGHVFLLTMSILFLADQFRYSLRSNKWSALHKGAVVANIALIGVWLFAAATTSIYFHSPFEKVTGFGLLGFAMSQVPVFIS